MSDTKAENLLDTIAELQARVNESKAKITELEAMAESDAKFIVELNSEKQKLVEELNKFRLGVFIPCRLIDPLDIRPLNTKNKWNILQLIKTEGMEAAQSVQRTIIDLATESSEIVEESKKKSIKVTLQEKADKNQSEVKKLREEKSPEAKQKRVTLSNMEKAVNGIRKRFPKANMATLIAYCVVYASITEQEAKECLESIFAKEAKSKEKK